MNAYVYQAALLCEECALLVREALVEEYPEYAEYPTGNSHFDGEDSDNFPVGPFPEGGGEADCPQHCDNCGKFLENPLTSDGVEYIMSAVADWLLTGAGSGSVIREWLDFYTDDLHYICETLDYGDIFGLLRDLRTSPAPFRVLHAAAARLEGVEVNYNQSLPPCEVLGCQADHAEYLVPSSRNARGSQVDEWHCVCETHAATWWDAVSNRGPGRWAGKMFRLVEVT